MSKASTEELLVIRLRGVLLLVQSHLVLGNDLELGNLLGSEPLVVGASLEGTRAALNRLAIPLPTINIVVLNRDGLDVEANNTVALLVGNDLVVLDNQLDVVEHVVLLVDALEPNGPAASKLSVHEVLVVYNHGRREIVNDPVVVIFVLNCVLEVFGLLSSKSLLAQHLAEVLQKHVKVVRGTVVARSVEGRFVSG